MVHRAAFALFLCAGTSAAQPGTVAGEPRFADYTVPVLQLTRPAPARFRTPGQRMFRTVIRAWARRGTNFAGHYTIAEWGCGTGCKSMAVVNNRTGEVHDGPFGHLPRASVCLGANTDESGAGVFYRDNSSLLIVRGCPNSGHCATYYYVWSGARFKLLRRVPLKPLSACGP